MLDGMVAVAANKASRRGEILNDLPDRISDVIIFAGVAHSGLMNPIFGYWAAILAVLTAYVGLFGQALGVRREFGGVMSKPWRMVTLHIGEAVITESILSFLGVGVPPTQPSLGTLIRIGNDFLFSGEWWITAFPGLALVVMVLSVNLIGDWLRDAIDPKSR